MGPQQLKFRKDTKTFQLARGPILKRELSRSQMVREGKPETRGKTVDLTTCSTQEKGTRIDGRRMKYVHGSVRRSDTVELLYLQFKRLSQLPRYSDRGLSQRRYSSVEK